MRAPRSAWPLALVAACVAALHAPPALADGEPDPASAEADDEPFAARRRRRPREPYNADEVSPFARNTLALAGTVVFGMGYFSPIFVLAPQGFPNNGVAMLVPVAGPWITLVVREEDGSSNEDAKRGFIAAAGVVQGAGAAIFVIGQLLRVTDPMGASRAPSSFATRIGVVPAGSGLQVYGSF